MTALDREASANPTFYLVQEEGEHHAETHDSPTLLGFWIYLMSDALIFATLFATYGVLATAYAGGPTPSDFFNLPLVALNTAFLLISSITYGMAMLAMQDGKKGGTQAWLAITALFGIAFISVELYEFAHMFHEGATPQRSAYLSAFFTLVATHGLHVTFGIIWIGVMLVQVGQRGLGVENQRRLTCLGMFWHLLDVVWIGVFTFVYLLGALS
ncbi:cytochrome o ubiquinol oxidase subunit III [Brevundimonas sp. Root1279]|uniref:cytochrome o ubiquinol oxidase subunit III n=1 Tax=Brevundimonas sp. Root1279 TaxID=1736443 RepID=UPI00070100E3|nr:cytochrome o ubiquinol oxidase subunit III [Brevundimonas sp. Root1279]KQW83901.1 cytochrome o ubiquinol oxidase subunit III [Brevundimonas sp. Root1279]